MKKIMFYMGPHRAGDCEIARVLKEELRGVAPVTDMFGSKDTLVHYCGIFEKYYSIDIDYDGSHTMTDDNVRNDLVSVIKEMLSKFPRPETRYFRHFKDNDYCLCHPAKDSETKHHMVVYHGYWKRPYPMFF